MLGISSYDSDEEPAKSPAPAPAPVKPAAKPQRIEPAAPAPTAKVAAIPKLAAQKLKELTIEIGRAKSATAVVNVIRTNLDTCWDVRWGAEALYQVAKRSTARTRQEWSEDRAIKRIGEVLVAEAEIGCSNVELILLALEALRRMSVQEPAAQKPSIERCIKMLVDNCFRNPVKSLVRVYWLGAPLSKDGSLKEHFQSWGLPSQIRQRSDELDGPDLALLLAGMRGDEGLKDAAMVAKVVLRLKSKDIHKGLSATDLVEMAEAFQEMAVTDEGALRPLGQEALRRRGELTPDESHRIHTAYQAMKLPLPKVWDAAGSRKDERTKRGIVTTQAFALQDGHEKKRRGNNDIERTSPPRVVRDMKMCSY